MKEGYVILEVGYEYNDEIYHTNNNSDTYEKPEEIYLNKEDAEAILFKKEVEAIRGICLSHYFYDIDEILNRKVSPKDFLDYCKKELEMDIPENEDEYYDLCIPEKASDEAIKGLLKMLSLKFFVLQKVKII